MTTAFPDSLLKEARAIHARQFNREASWAAIAPGRVNLIGDHTDYTGGFAMPFAVDRFTVALASEAPHSGHEVYASSVDECVRIDVDAGHEPDPTGSWNDYARGVIALLHDRGIGHSGLSITLHGDVPIGRGLSSSASLEMAVATLLEAVSGQSLDPVEKVRVCQEAENVYTGMPCGILDQYSVGMAKEGELMLLDCRDVSSTDVPVRSDEVCVLVADSRIRHELTDGQYAKRRQECHAAEEALGRSLRDVSSLSAGDIDDQDAYKRARHVVSENRRVLAMGQALSEGLYRDAGALMNASHASLRDDFESSRPEVDLLVQVCNSVDGVFGARMTGGGFGGSVVALVERDKAETAAIQIELGYDAVTGLKTEPTAVSPVAGATAVRIND